MIIKLKNNNKIIIGDFKFKCCIGLNGLISSKSKIEGDSRTPKGLFRLTELYYRKDRFQKVETKLKKTVIKKNMGWCDDSKSKFYNQLINTKEKTHFERLYRKDKKYDLLIVLDYNRKKITPKKGSAIFIHLTKNFKPTAGCIALKKNDMLILLKIINKKTFIKIS
jgi:L,D-peptidoglycan transpeptidase YkuD (ErfK/YbiS/YcfS/YnhG family)